MTFMIVVVRIVKQYRDELGRGRGNGTMFERAEGARMGSNSTNAAA